MLRYTLKRLAVGILTLAALATITFFLMKIIPGSPFGGELAQLSPEVVKALEGCVGNVEAFIRNKIEEVLPEIKDKYKALEAGKYLEAGEQPGLPEPQAAG